MCLCLVDDAMLEESAQVAKETLLEEIDAHRVKEELSQRLLERVVVEVIDNETRLVINDTYRYHSSYLSAHSHIGVNETHYHYYYM